MHVAVLGVSDVARYRELMPHAYASAPEAFTATVEERAAAPESWWLGRLADPARLHVTLGALSTEA